MKKESEINDFRVAVSTKLHPSDFKQLNHVCSLGNKEKSAFIREAIIDKLRAGAVSDVAGNNLIEYDEKTDSFAWKIKLDNNQEKILLDNIAVEFLQDLHSNITFQLNKRNDHLGKTKKNSVAVPKKLMK